MSMSPGFKPQVWAFIFTILHPNKPNHTEPLGWMNSCDQCFVLGQFLNLHEPLYLHWRVLGSTIWVSLLNGFKSIKKGNNNNNCMFLSELLGSYRHVPSLDFTNFSECHMTYMKYYHYLSLYIYIHSRFQQS